MMLVAMMLGLLPAGPASSTVSHCSFNSSSGALSVYINESDQRGRLFVDTGDAVKLFAGGVHGCEGVTLPQITGGIFVNGSSLADVFVLDMGGPGGRFPARIHIDIDLGLDDDLFRIRGTDRRDRYYFVLEVTKQLLNQGDRNGDGEFDMLLTSVENITALGRGGRDTLGSVLGTSGVMGGVVGEIKAARIPMRLVGGPEDDILVGGSRRDRLVGGAGDDEEVGRARNDVLLGGADDDSMNGGPGSDTCKGGPGSDAATKCERVRSVP